MTRKPKSIYCHYADSLIINCTNLKYFLKNHSISSIESENIVNLLSCYYNEKVNIILKVCDNNNWSKLESFSSPLILFICCIDKIITNCDVILSDKSRSILQSFLKSLESWMIW